MIVNIERPPEVALSGRLVPRGLFRVRELPVVVPTCLARSDLLIQSRRQ
jgi:hypothetical protein